MLCLWTTKLAMPCLVDITVLTYVGRFLQTRVCDEADRSMETLGMLEHIHGERHLFAFELSFDTFQRVFHAEPKVDLLRCRTRRYISRKLGHRLNLLDPRVDIRLQLVEKERVRQKVLWLNRIDRDPIAGRMTLQYQRIKMAD